MDFYAVLDQVLALLRQRQRVTYRALKVQFQLDDEALEALRDELIEAQHLAADEAGKVLVWTGEAENSPAPAPEPVRAPHIYTPPHLAEKILTSRSALAGERKQVTVLFADLKGSMELLADRDPEEARQLLDLVLEHMMAAVHRYEGTVNQVMGDGIMALFGAPIAHEDHAVRACYAALAMQECVQRYAEEVRRTQGLVVQMRVGLNAGEVVVRAIGHDLHMDYSAIGQTTHLAARMEQLAIPGSILLTATTLRLVEGLVRVRALGPIPVKGLTEPVEVYELVGVTAIRQRLQAAAARGLSQFVGRDHDLESLQQALRQARMEHGQVVAMVGEAGIGKSRLVYEFVRSHRTQEWLVLESASVSYGKATPYFPVLDLLRRYCHLEDNDDSRTIRAKVTGQVLTLDEALQDTLPALLALLDALPDDSLFFKLDPPQRRQRTLDALKRVLLPLLQAIAEVSEDAMYRGLTHLQAAELLYETRLFPEREYTFKHALTHEVAYGSLLQERRRALHAQIVQALETLAADRVAEQVERLAHHALRGEVWDKALAYCRQAGEKAMTRPAFREAVTCFEQALLAAQRLPTQRDLLAQGIDLRIYLDSAFLALGDPRRGFDSLREAAALAEELDDQRRLGLISNSLAHYVWRMGDYEAAIEYGQRALVHTTASGDIVEQARAHGLLGTVYVSLGDYRRAADVFRQSMATVEGDLRQARSAGLVLPSVRSRCWLVMCLTELGAFAEGMACGAEAARIAEAAGHLGSAIFIQNRLGQLVLRRGDLPQAIVLLEQALTRCRAANLALFLHTIAGHLGLAYALSGRVAEALPLFERMVEQEMAATQGNAPLLKGQGYLLAGNLEEARALAERALVLSRTHRARGNEVWSLRLLGEIARYGHPPDVAQAETYYRQALALAEELGMRPLVAHCHLGLGTLYARTTQADHARAELSTAIAMYREMDMTFWIPQAEAALAQTEER
jgi:class 3 adenylate cyclase/tetratricopeptide (TPR) repeat protein